MLCNREKINTYLNITNDSDKTYDLQIDDNIEFTYKILIFLKLFSLIVEKEKFQLFNVVPLVREFFAELNNLYKTATKTEWKRIINIIDASMRSRLSHNEIMNVPFEERILKDIYKNIYQISKSELVRAGSLLDIDYKYIEIKFDEYLFADPLQIEK